MADEWMLASPGIEVNLAGLQDKWFSEPRGDDRPCADCGKPLDRDADGRRFDELSETEEDEGEHSVPLILFRTVDDVVQQLDLHWRCAASRMRVP